jgi:hypothetical protein
LRPSTSVGPPRVIDEIDWRIRFIAAAVPIVTVALGALGSASDPRLGLIAGAVVVGWTKLVGL